MDWKKINGLETGLDWATVEAHMKELREEMPDKLLGKKEYVERKKRPKKLPPDRLAQNKLVTMRIANKYKNRDPHYLDDDYGDLVG